MRGAGSCAKGNTVRAKGPLWCRSSATARHNGRPGTRDCYTEAEKRHKVIAGRAALHLATLQPFGPLFASDPKEGKNTHIPCKLAGQGGTNSVSLLSTQAALDLIGAIPFFHRQTATNSQKKTSFIKAWTPKPCIFLLNNRI